MTDTDESESLNKSYSDLAKPVGENQWQLIVKIFGIIIPYLFWPTMLTVERPR